MASGCVISGTNAKFAVSTAAAAGSYALTGTAAALTATANLFAAASGITC
jgi:hypothetical protein